MPAKAHHICNPHIHHLRVWILTKLLTVATVVALVSAGLGAEARAQEGSDWYTNSLGGVENKDDNPTRHGPSQWWWARYPSGTHGWDHHGTYHFTYGASAASRTNWATWNFDDLSTGGAYDVWVWVPRADATAQVRYHVHLQGCTNRLGTFPVLDQANHGGWVKIGRVSIGHISNAPSNDIVLEVNDNDIADAHEAWAYRKIGVDAALLERGGGIGWTAVNSDHLITDASCFNRDWYTNSLGGVENKDDNPTRHGPSQWWWARYPSGSHGWDHHGTYHFTYGASAASRTNWATWNFDDLSTGGAYDVWVWVPRADATAQVRYHVHLQGCTNRLGTFPVLDQANHGGWVKIGRVSIGHISNAPSNDIVLEVNDNDIADAHEAWAYRKIGVDAALLERGGGIGWTAVNSDHLITDASCFPATSPTTTPPPATLPQYPYRHDNSPVQDEYKCLRYQYGFITSGTGDIDPWSFYGGECTSYVAFRLNQAGIPFHNWYGGLRWSHAKLWNGAADRVTGASVSTHPAVGSVAQWTDGDYGHVAYVEQVNSDGSIVVSDMNADGNCGLRERVTLTKPPGWNSTSGDPNRTIWPHNFIHFERD